LPKENKKEYFFPQMGKEEYLIIFGYSLLVFALISEPFVFQITNKEPIRIYGYLLCLIGAIILLKLLSKMEVKNKNGM